MLAALLYSISGDRYELSDRDFYALVLLNLAGLFYNKWRHGTKNIEGALKLAIDTASLPFALRFTRVYHKIMSEPGSESYEKRPQLQIKKLFHEFINLILDPTPTELNDIRKFCEWILPDQPLSPPLQILSLDLHPSNDYNKLEHFFKCVSSQQYINFKPSESDIKKVRWLLGLGETPVTTPISNTPTAPTNTPVTTPVVASTVVASPTSTLHYQTEFPALPAKPANKAKSIPKI
jgi:hypothetical protein